MVVKKLIPNNITVTEQIKLRDDIISAICKWSGQRQLEKIDLTKLEIESGIRCWYLVSAKTFVDLECVDEKLYMWFMLKWL